MKLWELHSAFRSENSIVENVLNLEKWKKYKTYFANFDKILEQQDRSILDEEVPFILSKQICELSALKFYFYFEEIPKRLSMNAPPTEHLDVEEMSAVEILIRFGGCKIEETLEYGSSVVYPRALNGRIEVLSVFKLKQVGILSFLRTENIHLSQGDILVSNDQQRKWKIVEESLPLLTPFKAEMKRVQQQKQHIRLYKIQPIQGSGKPFETELLELGS